MYNNQYMLDNLARQKDRIDDMIRSYQQPIITTAPCKDLIEWRILNENEEVDNLYVANKTLFINDTKMVLKGTDGSLEKWEVKKIYPRDKKDEKIAMLEDEIKKLKEAVNEHTKPIGTDDQFNESYGITDVNVEPRTKASSRTVQREIERRSMQDDSRIL